MNNLCLDAWTTIYSYLTPSHDMRSSMMLSKNSCIAMQQYANHFHHHIQTHLNKLKELQLYLTTERYQTLKIKFNLRSEYLFERVHMAIDHHFTEEVEKQGILVILCNKHYGQKFYLDCPPRMLSHEIHFDSMIGFQGVIYLCSWCKAYCRLILSLLHAIPHAITHGSP